MFWPFNHPGAGIHNMEKPSLTTDPQDFTQYKYKLVIKTNGPITAGLLLG
jgi:hypothetical protein